MKTCKYGHMYDQSIKRCLTCVKERNAKWYASNKERHKAYSKQWRADNAEHLKAIKAAWRARNPESVRNTIYKWNAKNLDKLRARRVSYTKNRKSVDPKFKMIVTLTSLVNNALTRRGYTKTSKVRHILGADFNVVFAHLIQTALNNYGFWLETETYHIDHVKPLSSASSKEEVVSLSHYSNLQLLYPIHNLQKSNRLDWKLPPP